MPFGGQEVVLAVLVTEGTGGGGGERGGLEGLWLLGGGGCGDGGWENSVRFQVNVSKYRNKARSDHIRIRPVRLIFNSYGVFNPIN